MVAGCAGESCHTGTTQDPSKFLGAGPEDQYYSAIVGHGQVHGNWNIADASLVTKLDLAGAAGHFGKQPWSDTEKAAIQAWFDIEKAAREGDNGQSPTPGRVDTRSLLAEWSGCMTKANWDQAQMGNWANKGTNNGACSNCHNEGQFWININPNNDTMFEMNKYELFIPGFFAAKLNPDGTGEIVPAFAKLVRMGQGNPGGSLHPVYNTDVNNDRYFQYLQNFVDLTKAAKQAGQCGPAGFPTPQ